MRTREGPIGSAAGTFRRAGFAVASLCVIGARAAAGGGAPPLRFAGEAARAGAAESAVPDRLRIIAEVASREGRAGSGAWPV
ncbi:hypothetical protein [Streptomyces triticiradicis]|uniref:Uncharacterized protein n=1 Tax=Streptomyces triticiradicis TaxID=2651189 RepID=A0A7J5DFB5_9ACTN|nr:hypothetical protein [Streptomyces triticiradicis]KAB1987552.1 hypothetical protein F8144_17725 [Streptomyces triticiradicis]